MVPMAKLESAHWGLGKRCITVANHPRTCRPNHIGSPQSHDRAEGATFSQRQRAVREDE